MRVIIIHDRKAVSDEIRQIVEGTGLVQSVDLAENFLEARDQLLRSYYDLAIVDLTLPFSPKDVSPTLLKAQELLEEMFAGPGMHAPGDILGITNDDDALELVRNKIGEHLMGCIAEKSNGAWREAISDRVKYVSRARAARQNITRSEYGVDLVIVTALDKEAAPYNTLFELRDNPDLRGAKSFNFYSCDGKLRRGVLYSVNASGPAPTASATQNLLNRFRPRLILMSGFCGGIKGRTKLGDLLAVRSSFAWDYGKWVDKKEKGSPAKPKFKPRPTPLNIHENAVGETIRKMLQDGYRPSNETMQNVAAASRNAILDWRIKPVAAGSGSAVVTSLDILEQITDLDENIWAVEMESYAFYHACRNTDVIRPDFICIKSVADYCNGAKSSKQHAACSLISASFARDLVHDHYRFDVALA